MPFEFQRQVRDLISSYGAHLDDFSPEFLSSLPKGWIGAVRGMLDRVEQILCDSEQVTFRWTTLTRQRDRLVVQWSGAETSGDLVEQIVEETVGEARNTCVDCGAPTFVGIWESDGPRCLFHATWRSGLGRIMEWNLTAFELIRALQGSFGSSMHTNLHPKSVAAALPLLIRDAAAYFSEPDQDVKAITQQLQEALNRLEQQIRRHTNTPLTVVDRR